MDNYQQGWIRRSSPLAAPVFGLMRPFRAAQAAMAAAARIRPGGGQRRRKDSRRQRKFAPLNFRH